MLNKAKEVDWEKASIYIVVTATLLTGLIYIADIKERLRATEVEIVNLKESKPSIKIEK